jgi:hypothetical protein
VGQDGYVLPARVAVDHLVAVVHLPDVLHRAAAFRILVAGGPIPVCQVITHQGAGNGPRRGGEGFALPLPT